MNMTCSQICRIAILVAAGILISIFSLNVTDVAQSEEKQNPKDIFNDIRRAWQQSDVDKLMNYIGDAKTIISFENEGLEKGLYSRNQAHYLFGKLVKKTKTTDFTIVKIIEEQNQNSNPHAFAHRTYTDLSDGSQKHEQMYISLSKFHHQWFITHIMSIEKKSQHPGDDSKPAP